MCRVCCFYSNIVSIKILFVILLIMYHSKFQLTQMVKGDLVCNEFRKCQYFITLVHMSDLKTLTIHCTSMTLFYREHKFDLPRRYAKPKRKSGTVSELSSCTRGAQGVRSFHRLNEEKNPST